MEGQNTKKRIVVVGGGAAGVATVRGLGKVLDASKHELILITARPRFAYLPATLRVLVDKNAATNMVFMSYNNVFNGFPGELKIGCVSSIDENKMGKGGRVVLKTGEQVSYDVLVVATGSSWQGLLSFPDEESLYEEHIETWRKNFEKAQNIVIVGGGAVGIEAAGEIKDVYPDKRVTIVQHGKYLMNDIYPRKFRVDLERRLRLRGVDIIFDDAIEGHAQADSDTPLKTHKGTSLPCDLLLTARGASPNTSLFKFILPTPLDDKDFVQVEPTLQVRNHPSIFAAGDIINLPEAKQFQKTAGHAKVIVANIMSYLTEQPLEKQCHPAKEIIIISNGKRGGASYIGILWGIQLGDTFTRIAKSRDLLVGIVRKSLGFPVDS